MLPMIIDRAKPSSPPIRVQAIKWDNIKLNELSNGSTNAREKRGEGFSPRGRGLESA